MLLWDLEIPLEVSCNKTGIKCKFPQRKLVTCSNTSLFNSCSDDETNTVSSFLEYVCKYYVRGANFVVLFSVWKSIKRMLKKKYLAFFNDSHLLLTLSLIGGVSNYRAEFKLPAYTVYCSLPQPYQKCIQFQLRQLQQSKLYSWQSSSAIYLSLS